jgi:trimeric autotransporter adhesin
MIRPPRTPPRAAALAFALCLVFAARAADPPTPAGTRLVVQVEATFLDAERVTQRIVAEPAVLIVQEVRGARLTPAEAPERRVPPGARAEFGFTVVNAGNAPARIGVTATAPYPAVLVHDLDCDGRAADGEPRLTGDAQGRSLPLPAGGAGCIVVVVDVPAATPVGPDGVAGRVTLTAAPLSNAPEAPGQEGAARVGGGALTVVAGGAMAVTLAADPAGTLPAGGRLRLDADARAGGGGPLCAAATEVLRADGTLARGILAALTVPAGLAPVAPATGAASVGTLRPVHFGPVALGGTTQLRWASADRPLAPGATPSAIGVLIEGDGCFFPSGATLRASGTFAEAAAGATPAGAPLASVAEILHRDPAGRDLTARSNEVRPAVAPVRAFAIDLPPAGGGNFAPNDASPLRRIDGRQLASVRGNTTLRFVEFVQNTGNVATAFDVVARAHRGTFDPATGAALRWDGSRVANLLQGVGQVGDAYEVAADGRASLGGVDVALVAGDHLVWRSGGVGWVRESPWRCTPLRADLLTPGEARIAPIDAAQGRAVGVACAVPIDAVAPRHVEIVVAVADLPAGATPPPPRLSSWRIDGVEPGFAVAVDVREGAGRSVPDGGEAVYLIAVANALADGSVDRYRLTATPTPAAFAPTAVTLHRADCALGLGQARGAIEPVTPAVAPGGVACMLLVVRIATGARSGPQFRAAFPAARALTLTATSLTVASVAATTTLDVDVAHRGGIDLAPERSGTTTTPGDVAVTHTIRNLGNSAGVARIVAGGLEPAGAGATSLSFPDAPRAPLLTVALAAAGSVAPNGTRLDEATFTLHLTAAAGLPNAAILRAPLTATIDYTALNPQSPLVTASVIDTFDVVDGTLLLELRGCAAASDVGECRGDAASARPGDYLHYTLIARNAGGAPLEGVVLLQPLPTFTNHVRVSGSTDFAARVVFGSDGETFADQIAAVPTGGSLFAAVRGADGDAIPAGGSVTVRWVVRVR